MPMPTIAGRFEIFAQLSHSVFFAHDRTKCCYHTFQSIVVLKCVTDCWKEELVWEERVYEVLGDADGFASVRWSGEDIGLYWIAMDYKGCNFERLRFFLKEEFTVQKVALFAVQMLFRIKHLHSLGFVHGDIMPSNFTFGPITPAGFGAHGVAKVNLIDFGASRNCSDGGALIAPSGGHPAFISLRLSASQKILPEKRDDLESLAYTILYLINGDLPWWVQSDDDDFLSDSPTSIKSKTRPEDLCNGLPFVYREFVRYSRELKVGTEPDYDFFIEAFARVGLGLCTQT